MDCADAPGMSEQSEALKARTTTFAVAVLGQIDAFPRTPGALTVARQLAESATSEAANYRAACTARSRREFISKLCIVNEEADESVFWLEVTRRTGYRDPGEVSPLEREAVELRAILARSLATARSNDRRGKYKPHDGDWK